MSGVTKVVGLGISRASSLVETIVKKAPEGMNIEKFWRFPEQPVHAVQLSKNTVQRNGINLNRILTIYGNDAVTIETLRTLPNGQKAYSIGTRFPNKTQNYMSENFLNKKQCLSGQEKTFRYQPDAVKLNLNA